ncbi:biotin/lipoyl-binding protein [Hathewaya massiliensis]|uniref:HlyD family efflux transporter periplasmic adaptor subunit n=1 Tax=Hathewaya massiliensis TaxID=1964382 RepID=UPI00115BF7A8|nr:biotin/lipoyl-binding protein [Hathewaya massiliensis]
MKYKIENIEELSDSRELMEMKPNKFVSMFIYILLFAIFSFLLWAWFSEKEVVIKVSGFVTTKEKSFTASNPIPGTVKEIYLKNGQDVKKGDLLYTIDDTRLQNQKKNLDKQKINLNKKLKNLEKLKKSIEANKNYFTDHEEEKEYYYKYKTYEPGNMVVVQEKDRLLTSKINLNNKIQSLKILDKSIEENKNHNNQESIYSIQFDNFQISKKEIENKISQLEKSKENFKEQNVPNEQILQIEAEIESYKKQLTKLRSDLKLQIYTSLDELNMQMKDIDNSINKFNENAYLSKEKNKVAFLADIEAQRTLVNGEIQQIDFKLKEINKNIETCQVKSESDGKIDIKTNLQSGVMVEAGAIIAYILPKSNEYKIELLIAEKDIMHLKEGQEIKYSFNSLPYNEYGFLKGEIKNLSINSKLNNQNGDIFYTGEGSLEKNALYRSNGEKSEIKVGITCEARVIVRKTRMLYYFFEKLNFKSAS